jgi:hypothetical protein
MLVLSGIWFFCGARSCVSERSSAEYELAQSRDSLAKAAAIAHPDPEQLASFEERAKQTLTDFTGYLEIASDTTLDPSFRQQAARMAGKLVFDENLPAGKWADAFTAPASGKLSQIPATCLTAPHPLKVRAEQVLILRPLDRLNDTVYSGTLSFTYHTNPDDSARMAVDFYACREVKQFGTQKVNQWGIRLGVAR